MKNVILIVAFNYSNCLNNLEFIKNLYKKYFKKIIFYSDVHAVLNSDEVNFVNIGRGKYLHKIFPHFYKKYHQLLKDCDGLFYTMDDNIINTNLLNLLSTKKIIYKYKDLHPMEHCDGWQWDKVHGREALKNLLAELTKISTNYIKFISSYS